MPQLSPTSQQAIQDVAQRHGFSVDAVASMLASVTNGHGSQAQFSHPEFGGNGQWMQGGMTMIGDMFDNHLKSRVANLCADLSRLIVSQTGQTSVNRLGGLAETSENKGRLFVDAPVQPNWWGTNLGQPNSSGGQNGMRYAWFSQTHRLAMESGGKVIVYDTLNHQIGGVSQQQSGGYSVTFSSQYGDVDVSQLPVAWVNGVAPPDHSSV